MTALERRKRQSQLRKQPVASRHCVVKYSTPDERRRRLSLLGETRRRANDANNNAMIIPTTTTPVMKENPVDPTTMALMQCHVRHLSKQRHRHDEPPLGDVLTSLSRDPDVRDSYCRATTLFPTIEEEEENNNNTGELAANNNWNNNNIWQVKERIYQRRKEWILTWTRCLQTVRQQQQAAWHAPVGVWDQVQEACAGFWKFPNDRKDDVAQQGESSSSSQSSLDTYLQRLANVGNAAASLTLPSQRLWQTMAAFASSHAVVQTQRQDDDDDDDDDENQRTAVFSDKSDQFWYERGLQAQKDRIERLVSGGLRTARERWEQSQQQDPVERLLRPLTEDEQWAVNDILQSGGVAADVVAQVGTDIITRQNMQTLRPRCWLSDEVIHFFLAMLAQRDQALCEEDPKRRRCHFFKSFFVTTLLNQGHAVRAGVYEYRNVKRWSKKVPGKDIFALDKIVFPINVNRSHWVCAVAFMQERRIQFYDSMGDSGVEFLQAIFQYIQDEHKDKKKAPLPDVHEWRLVPCTADTPQQQNLVDCGVFVCMFADFVTKDCPLLFGQQHIDKCRDRIALSILQGRAIM